MPSALFETYDMHDVKRKMGKILFLKKQELENTTFLGGCVL